MRSLLAASLVLLAAAGPPAPPRPTTVPGPPAAAPALPGPPPVAPTELPLPPLPAAPASEPASAQATRQALQGAEQAQQQAMAAAKAAAEAASAAAAERAKLDQARAAITLRLRMAESATEEVALKLDQLGRQRARARARLARKVREFTPVLPVLEQLSMYPAATLLAVPAPPEDALRGVLVLQAIAAGFEREAKALRAEENRVDELAAKIAAAKTKLKAAEAEQAAEAAQLDQEIAATRTVEQAAMGQQAAAEAAAVSAAAQAKTLEGAIAAIAEAAREAEAARQAEAARAAQAAQQAALAREREQLALARPEIPPPPLPETPPVPPHATGAPVAGVLVSGYGAPTPAGPSTGIRYQTAPGAHVLAPCAGSVEFAAPFRSYGRLVILDCGGGYRFVLAGMQTLLVAAGAGVAAGQALGVMAEWDPGSPGPRPTLYLELHHGREVINPLPWLRGRG